MSEELNKSIGSKKGIIAIISIAVIIIGLFIFIFLNKEPKEIELKDQDLINIIDENLSYLNNLNTDAVSNKPSIYNKNTKISDISYEKKLHSILFTLTLDEKSYVEYSDEEFEEVTSNLPGLGIDKEDFPKISDSLVSEKLNKVYGISDIDPEVTIESCPTYFYNEKYKSYYLGTQCGGYPIDKTLTYVYKYTKLEDTIYAYVSVGYIELEVNTEDLSDTKYILYTSYDKKTEYQKDSDLEKLELNNDNYNEFKKYKIAFTKKGDNYIFTNSEEIN